MLTSSSKESNDRQGDSGPSPAAQCEEEKNSSLSPLSISYSNPVVANAKGPERSELRVCVKTSNRLFFEIFTRYERIRVESDENSKGALKSFSKPIREIQIETSVDTMGRCLYCRHSISFSEVGPKPAAGVVDDNDSREWSEILHALNRVSDELWPTVGADRDDEDAVFSNIRELS